MALLWLQFATACFILVFNPQISFWGSDIVPPLDEQNGKKSQMFVLC